MLHGWIDHVVLNRTLQECRVGEVPVARNAEIQRVLA
jgi:hypothetical protein